MKPIRLFLTDVDGCLTDGGMYYGASGEEMKRFCVYDGMGMVLLRKAGIKCGILTSETTEIVARRAQKLQLDYLYQGVGAHNIKTKLDTAKDICAELNISLDEVCYVGDDINDIDLLREVGLAPWPPGVFSMRMFGKARTSGRAFGGHVAKPTSRNKSISLMSSPT